MEPLLESLTLSWCLPGSQAHLKAALQLLWALPRFPAASSACTTQVIRAKVRLSPADFDRLELDWYSLQTWDNTLLCLCMLLYIETILGASKLCYQTLIHQVSKLGHLEVRGFFVLFFKSTTKNSGEDTNESSLYTKPQKIHMPIILTWHGNLGVSSIVLAFKKNSCAVTVLVYNSLVTSVLHPMSAEHHKVMKWSVTNLLLFQDTEISPKCCI